MNSIVGNLVVKAGTSRSGSPIWQKCGVLMESDGRQYILMSRTFNPAGVPISDQQKDSITVSIFPPDASKQPRTPAPAKLPVDYSRDDDIPF